MNTIKLDKQGSAVKMIAHRGLSGLERENTCAAFVAAGNRETYWGIETDVHRTADGQYVIFHDDNTLRMTGSDMIVEETDLKALRSLQIREREGEPDRGDLILPTLQEYLRICKRYEKTAVLELKNSMREEAICEIMEIVKNYGCMEKLTVISFYPDNLIHLRKHYPKQSAQFLSSRWEDPWLELLAQYDLDLDIRHTVVTKELVDNIHSIGKSVNCWTVDTVADAARLIDCGVDYITTNILE